MNLLLFLLLSLASRRWIGGRPTLTPLVRVVHLARIVIGSMRHRYTRTIIIVIIITVRIIGRRIVARTGITLRTDCCLLFLFVLVLLECTPATERSCTRPRWPALTSTRRIYQMLAR
uniref:Putative secreted protein n=1 Tax=Anopheles marajoara TaxID=58244 RepID=A0A2M4C836_9DIPT